MASAFKVGDLVWAKMKGFPPWPGLVSEPPDNKKINEKKPKFYIFFFGSENYAWVTFDNMWPYLEKREEYVAMLRPTHSFQEAVDAIDDYVREHGGTIPVTQKKSPSPAKNSDNEEDRLGSGRRSRKRLSAAVVSESLSKTEMDNKPKSPKKESEKKKRKDSLEDKKEKKEVDKHKPKKLFEEEDDDIELKSKKISRKRNNEKEDDEKEEDLDNDIKISKEFPSEKEYEEDDEAAKSMLVKEVKTPSKEEKENKTEDKKEQKKTEDKKKPERSSKRESKSNDNEKDKIKKKAQETPAKKNGVVSSATKRKGAAIEKKNEASAKKAYLPDVLSTTTSNKSVTSSTKKLSSIIPTEKKIGFIGCGNVGSKLVENLLQSGHHISIWNRTAAKCKDLIKRGASKCTSASDVVKKCDIIIMCLSDAPAFKDVVYGSDGVLGAMKEGKGLVNMTTVDVETTLDACEAVTSVGGSFLEVAMLGSIENAGKGELLLLVSGNQTLYDECSSIFKVISKNIFNLVDIGTATKMQVVFNNLYATTIAGLAEGLSLASKVGIDPAEVLELVAHTSAISPLIKSKGEAMVKNNLSDVGIKLDTLQKDIRLAINMSEEVDQPLHVGSVVNELFKKAKAKGYGESDVAAVFRATDL